MIVIALCQDFLIQTLLANTDDGRSHRGSQSDISETHNCAVILQP